MYHYKFDCTKAVGKPKLYTNPAFVRGCYADMITPRMVKLKPAGPIPDDLVEREIRNIKEKYSRALVMALKLKSENEDLINKNRAAIVEDLSLRMSLVDRAKGAIFVFLVHALYYEVETENLIKRHAFQSLIANPPVLSDQFEKTFDAKQCAKFFNLHIENMFLNSHYVINYIMVVFKVLIRRLNNRFFHKPFGPLYTSILHYILDNERPDSLVDHPNFYVLKHIKECTEFLFSEIFTAFCKQDYLQVIEQHCKHSSFDLPADLTDVSTEKCDESFSMRSFKDQLLLNTLDTFESFNMVMDD